MMTIEEKAKAYDEAIEVAQRFYNNCVAITKKGLEDIFPVLKESEGERIRREIISYLKRRLKFDSSIPAAIGYWIAWLEKQGEQKPWSEEDETIKNNISHIIRQYDKISKRENQPCYYVGDCLLWMQNIKDRVQPQPKQEWSEEDNEHIKSIISTIECSKAQFPNSPAVLEAYNSDLIWFKSLRPQKQWKPSDEQMDILKLSTYCQNEQMSKVLSELYQDLKKLREE